MRLLSSAPRRCRQLSSNVGRHHSHVDLFHFGERRRARDRRRRRASAASSRRCREQPRVGRECWIGCVHEYPTSPLVVRLCRRAWAPSRVPQRSRPSAFAGARRGHPLGQFHARGAPAAASARWPQSRFVFNSPGALVSAACLVRRRWSWPARSVPLAGLAGVSALNARNAAQQVVQPDRQRHGALAARRCGSSCASRPGRHAVVGRLTPR